MKIKDKKAFTIVEMMVVIGLMAIVMVMMTTSFGKQKAKTRDNIRIAAMQEIRLALEEYKLACGYYPNRLDTAVSNGKYGVEKTCPSNITLGNFLPHIPQNPPYGKTGNKTNVSTYYYRGLSSTSGGPCYDYYLGVELESGADNGYQNNKYLQKEDHDWEGNNGFYKHPCLDADTAITTHSDGEGWYDFKSQKN